MSKTFRMNVDILPSASAATCMPRLESEGLTTMLGRDTCAILDAARVQEDAIAARTAHSLLPLERQWLSLHDSSQAAGTVSGVDGLPGSLGCIGCGSISEDLEMSTGSRRPSRYLPLCCLHTPSRS